MSLDKTIMFPLCLILFTGCDIGNRVEIVNGIEYVEGAVWIEQQSGIQPEYWDKTSLIFGHGMHNFSFCQQYIEAHMQQIGGITLRCAPVN